jgi:hypothetical protein
MAATGESMGVAEALMAMPVVFLAAEDETGKNFNEDVKT